MRPSDDDPRLLPHGQRGRLHRFAVRMSKIASTLIQEKQVINSSPVLAMQAVKPFMETNSLWRPYQIQLLLKRYFSGRFAGDCNRLFMPRAATIEFAGPGARFRLRRLCPAGFALFGRMGGPAGVDESEWRDSGTVNPRTTPAERDFARMSLEVLVHHQSKMELSEKENALLGLPPSILTACRMRFARQGA